MKEETLTRDFILKNFCNTNGNLIGKKVLKSNYSKELLAKFFHNDSGVCLCGKEKKLISFKKGFNKTCSNRNCIYWKDSVYSKIQETKTKNDTLQSNHLIIEKTKRTKLEKYGDENYNNSEKNRETCLKNGSDEKRLEKIKKTKLEKYGDEFYFDKEKMKKTKTKNNSLPSSLEVINKSRETKIKNNSFRTNDIVQEKIKKTKLEKYGNKKYNNSKRNINNIKNFNKEYIEKFFIDSDGFFEFEKYLEYFNISTTYAYISLEEFGIFNIKKHNKNKIEFEISSYINNSIVNSRKIIPPFELDIYSEENKFAIEYNGIMWHSFGKSKHSMFNNYELENKNYHLNKTELCEKQNIQLYHIFENEWLDKTKKSIWISMLNDKQGLNRKIGARKCIIRGVPTKDAREFIEENHLQGYSNSKIKIGLYFEDELISIMTFGKSRYNKDIECELIRFCSKKGITVQGGASRLLKYFEREYKPKSLLSYANRRWSTGNVYEKLGFEFKHNSSPNFFWFFPGENKLMSRIIFQKHKLKGLLENFNENKSASENMYNNGFRKIYDCGNKVYIKKYSKETNV